MMEQNNESHVQVTLSEQSIALTAARQQEKFAF